MADVARFAGDSVPTVSCVLTGSIPVSRAKCPGLTLGATKD